MRRDRHALDGVGAGPDQQQVHPHVDEGGRRPERLLQVHVLFAGARERCAELGEAERAEHGEDGGDGPEDEREARRAGLAHHGRRRDVDAAADDEAAEDDDAVPEAQLPLEMDRPAAVSRLRRRCRGRRHRSLSPRHDDRHRHCPLSLCRSASTAKLSTRRTPVVYREPRAAVIYCWQIFILQM